MLLNAFASARISRTFPPFSMASFAALLFLLLLQSGARAQDQTIYTDSLQNGWQSYSWATVDFGNTSPVHSGSASIKVDAGAYQALYLHHSSFPSQAYAALSFWVNGGAGGGQSLQVEALANGGQSVGLVTLSSLAANQWTHIVIPLAQLGASNISSMDGIWIKNTTGGTLPTFYVDDVALTAVVAPTSVGLSVNNNQAVRTVDNRMFGVNAAIWDGQFNTQATVDLLTASDNQTLRFPGGSISDDYHWQTNTTGGNTWQWTNGFDSFSNIVHQTTAQVFVTVNYGTGTAQEAAEWVRYSNVTKGLGYKFWEVGNENYGTWETDSNTTDGNRAHDPYTYATRFKEYFTAMKAVDRSIKVGAVIITGEDAWGNYSDHPTLNPRTNVNHIGWGPVMLGRLKALGVTPDFVIYHQYPQYPGNESDSSLLQSSTSWASDVASLRQMLGDYLGKAGATVEIICTENNSVSSGPGKQSTSLVNGLFLADSIGQALQTELKGLVWWDMRNAQEYSNNNNASLYGWRQYGDYGIVSPNNDRYPVYYVSKLLKNFARGGDTVIQATSDYALLSVYAARRTNGTLALLVINKSPNLTLNGSVALSGYAAHSGATTHTYGIPQDNAAQSGSGSPDVATGTLSGGTANGFTAAFPPYSVTVITLKPSTAPAAPTTLAVFPQTGGRVSLTWRDNSNNESGFEMERSLDGTTFTRIKTTGANAITFTDTGRAAGQLVWYRVRAVNTAGASGYSNTVSGTAR